MIKVIEEYKRINKELGSNFSDPVIRADLIYLYDKEKYHNIHEMIKNQLPKEYIEGVLLTIEDNINYELTIKEKMERIEERKAKNHSLEVFICS
jgi:hypothetical protein